ncbi:uncharacterized protein BX664DRAFT_333976 [Halteromyces radiatus]|uniref:uncharacterized protein n=1 Tax=Halteromyces radiatus TaxID=101107 RepID=UPI00221E7CB2|nr:uncharacterized protein BX664DRAFT_333976 [Halteromyces radiatus]KAI8089814.1 hypothetical protein BX664DRAFT_333976 [Halteromyces radiatus]
MTDNQDDAAVVPNVTERTRLLDSTTTTTSYTTQVQVEEGRSQQQVVDMTMEHDPTVPLDELTDHIQHLLVFGKHRGNGKLSQSSSSSNGSGQVIMGEQEVDIVQEEGQRDISSRKSKKRDLITGALRFATDQWMENQGINNQVIHESIQQGPSTSTSNQLPPLPLVSHEESAKGVWDVAKNASVCAVLGLLSERRQGKISLTSDADATLQRLALSTLEHGVKQTSASDMIRQEMLFKPWLGDKSAIQWAIENDSSVFLNDENVQTVIKESWWYGDIDWKTNPNHPFQAWNTSSYQENRTTVTRQGWKAVFTKQFIASYLARWASPRYQCLIAFFTAVVYLSFHLATLSNVEYMEDHLKPYEYFYYVLVISDLVLELGRFITSPRKALQKPSTYLTLPTAILLTAAFVFRILAFFATDLQPKYHGFYFSFVLLAIATPLMVFRLFLWVDDLWWPVYKINYVVGRCLVQSLWVFLIGLVSLIGFWLGLSALQRDDIGPWLMLRHLILGALHSPEIGETLYYQPQAASILLVAYLFVMVVFLGALLTASFLSTILTLMKPESSFNRLKQRMEAERCSRRPNYGVYIPNVAVELIVGSIVWIVKKISPGTKLTWLERLRQIIWFIIFLPILILIGLFDLVVYLFSLRN